MSIAISTNAHAKLPGDATATTAQRTLIAQSQMKSITANHLIGYKNGSVTAAENAQIDACVAAFMDGKTALIEKDEILLITEEEFYPMERDICAERAQLPDGQSYCRRYGPKELLVGQLMRLRSQKTGRPLQLFCLARGDEASNAVGITQKSLGTLFTY